MSDHSSTKNVEGILELVDKEYRNSVTALDLSQEPTEALVCAAKVEVIGKIRHGIDKVLIKTLKETMQALEDSGSSFPNRLRDEDDEVPIKSDDVTL